MTSCGSGITHQHSTAGRALSRVGFTRTVPPGRSVAVRLYCATEGPTGKPGCSGNVRRRTRSQQHHRPYAAMAKHTAPNPSQNKMPGEPPLTVASAALLMNTKIASPPTNPQTTPNGRSRLRTLRTCKNHSQTPSANAGQMKHTPPTNANGEPPPASDSPTLTRHMMTNSTAALKLIATKTVRHGTITIVYLD